MPFSRIRYAPLCTLSTNGHQPLLPTIHSNPDAPNNMPRTPQSSTVMKTHSFVFTLLVNNRPQVWSKEQMVWVSVCCCFSAACYTNYSWILSVISVGALDWVVKVICYFVWYSTSHFVNSCSEECCVCLCVCAPSLATILTAYICTILEMKTIASQRKKWLRRRTLRECPYYSSQKISQTLSSS